jgi:hypothetical protein
VAVKTPLLPPLSTAATVDNAAIGAVGSIPPSKTNAIAAIDNCHHRCLLKLTQFCHHKVAKSTFKFQDKKYFMSYLCTLA